MKRSKTKCGCTREALCVHAKLLESKIRATYRRTESPEEREQAWWEFDRHVLAANGR